MRTAYFDCFSGASGDMILGALLDVGLELDCLKADLDKLGLDHCRLSLKAVTRRGIGGSQAIVEIDQEHQDQHHRRLSDILDILSRSGLSESVKKKAAAVFVRLAEAEARVHHSLVESVHFHEVGAMDAIIDVVGAVAGLERLGIETVHCSPIKVGFGMTRCAHGLLPVPAPATAELVKGFPVYGGEAAGELLTPTGAAILTTLADRFGPMGQMTVRKIGYGAGAADTTVPNLLRLIVGDGL
ncbi:MAG: nickel pincer cofactor biosynthesis protein LarC [Thermodesulfobacteriota bacterium]